MVLVDVEPRKARRVGLGGSALFIETRLGIVDVPIAGELPG